MNTPTIKWEPAVLPRSQTCVVNGRSYILSPKKNDMGWTYWGIYTFRNQGSNLVVWGWGIREAKAKFKEYLSLTRCEPCFGSGMRLGKDSPPDEPCKTCGGTGFIK